MLSSSKPKCLLDQETKHLISTTYESVWTSEGVTFYQRLMVCSSCPRCDVSSIRTKGQSKVTKFTGGGYQETDTEQQPEPGSPSSLPTVQSTRTSLSHLSGWKYFTNNKTPHQKTKKEKKKKRKQAFSWPCILLEDFFFSVCVKGPNPNSHR